MSSEAYKVRIGRLWELVPLSKELMDALEHQTLPKHIAATWLFRRGIIFGGGEKKYDGLRKKFIELEGGEE